MSLETCVVQEVWRDRVWAARPMRLVRDEGDFAALWFPRGTRWKAPTTPSGRPREEDRGERLAQCALRGDWVFRDAEWDVDTLVLLREGAWHAVWVSWLPSGAHWGWYVNLQLPYRRTEVGFETMDPVLDLIIDPDRSWRWKDERELETWVARGVCRPELADRIRAEGLEVAGRAERNETPFCEPWPEWRPEAAWELPALPAAWDVRQ
jgi:Protein of unknown function (DUF402)